MAKGNFKGGNVFAGNLQGGNADVTIDSSGDGTLAVTFDHVMQNTPSLVATSQEQLVTGVISFTSITQSGCTVVVDGSNVTADTLTVGYMAFDDSYR